MSAAEDELNGENEQLGEMEASVDVSSEWGPPHLSQLLLYNKAGSTTAW